MSETTRPLVDAEPGCPRCYLRTGNTLGMAWYEETQEWECPRCEAAPTDREADPYDLFGDTAHEPAAWPWLGERYRWGAHNLIAHPLLVIWPRLGEWLHDRTVPDV